ncbi:hypothetical protein ZIOFF_046310 [Zingiber officinale]|uniref:AP2/ERF domain-containing protein n=1 Tax=Zingiber officinale TaxID=94328 RepID=A0A8J5G4V5_ZINOF|nr:hypothetical protein ZIOFF_046310 [Zingiber officinale]
MEAAPILNILDVTAYLIWPSPFAANHVSAAQASSSFYHRIESAPPRRRCDGDGGDGAAGAAAGEEAVPAPAVAPSRKGCMKGKGGPDNQACAFRGVRQSNCGTRLWLGTFAIALDAARSLYGDCARLNLPTSTSTTADESSQTSISGDSTPGVAADCLYVDFEDFGLQAFHDERFGFWPPPPGIAMDGIKEIIKS